METKTMEELKVRIVNIFGHLGPKTVEDISEVILELIEKEREEAFKDGYKSKEDEIRDSEISDEQQNKIIDKILETKKQKIHFFSAEEVAEIQKDGPHGSETKTMEDNIEKLVNEFYSMNPKYRTKANLFNMISELIEKERQEIITKAHEERERGYLEGHNKAKDEYNPGKRITDDTWMSKATRCSYCQLLRENA